MYFSLLYFLNAKLYERGNILFYLCKREGNNIPYISSLSYMINDACLLVYLVCVDGENSIDCSENIAIFV